MTWGLKQDVNYMEIIEINGLDTYKYNKNDQIIGNV